MLKRFLHTFARSRHPWRTMKFDELAEIYTSMSLRSFGLGIIGIFVPIFLYKSGISLQGIFLFYSLFFLLRVPAAFASSFVIGRIGPKHSIAVSTIIAVIFLLMLLTLDYVGWPLMTLAAVFSTSNGLFFIASHTDFSKIKDSKHGGKELGWLYMFERGGAALGPVAGGLIASFISPEITIGVAVVVMFGSLVPLFITNEPVKTHQKIKYKNFPWQRHKSDYISLSAFGVENAASLVMWPLFISVTIFLDDTYVKLGSLVALSIFVSMFSAQLIGKTIDNNKGGLLLKFGVFINAITHVVRSFITNGSGALAVTTLNEPTMLSYKMPLVKGFYDAADSEEGYRIVYLTTVEMITGFAKALFCFGLLIATIWFDPVNVLRWCFIVVSVISLCILLQRFPALKKT